MDLLQNLTTTQNSICEESATAWIYVLSFCFSFTLLLSASSLLFAVFEAKKKHQEIETRSYQGSDISSEGYSDYEEEAPDFSDMYETLPDEYKTRFVGKRKSNQSSQLGNLDNIIEDEHEEDYESSEESSVNGSIEGDSISKEIGHKSSEDSFDDAALNRFSKYRGSMEKVHRRKSIDLQMLPPPSHLTVKKRGSLREDVTDSGGSSISSQVSRTSETSRSRMDNYPKLSFPNNARTAKESLKLPRSSLARSESQKRADYLLKVITKGGNLKDFETESQPPVVEKRSPTGRKISTTDIRSKLSPRNSLSFANGNRRGRICEDSASTLNHTYVNLEEFHDTVELGSFSNMDANQIKGEDDVEDMHDEDSIANKSI